MTGDKRENPYPWLTIKPDGRMDADMEGTTGAEMDRRMVIFQEIRAERLVPMAEHDRLRDAARDALDWIEELTHWVGPGVTEDRDDVLAALAAALRMEDR